jgi:hypothetical protein
MRRSGMVQGHPQSGTILEVGRSRTCPSTMLRMVPLPFQGRIFGSRSTRSKSANSASYSSARWHSAALRS